MRHMHRREELALVLKPCRRLFHAQAPWQQRLHLCPSFGFFGTEDGLWAAAPVFAGLP